MHVITVRLEVDADDRSSARAAVRMLMPLGIRVLGRLATVTGWSFVSDDEPLVTTPATWDGVTTR